MIPDFGIVLSGGGARGVAHIGVLKSLEDHGISPGIVAGTSMGAVVGSLYASGVPIDQMLEIARGKKITSLFSLKSMKNCGVLSLNLLHQTLSENIKEDSFESLNKKFFLNVSNITQGKQEIVSSGNLFQWILASTAIPIVFEPQRINGNSYVDGALFNNFLVEPLIGNCKKIIGSHVNHTKIRDNLSTFRSVAERVYTLAIYKNVEENIKMCDYVIEPEELCRYNVFDFKKIDKIFEIGYIETEKIIEKIKNDSREDM